MISSISIISIVSFHQLYHISFYIAL